MKQSTCGVGPFPPLATKLQWIGERRGEWGAEPTAVLSAESSAEWIGLDWLDWIRERRGVQSRGGPR